MIVPRSFSPPSPSYLSEKNDLIGRGAGSRTKQARSPQRSVTLKTRTQSPVPLDSRSDPVAIPSRNAKHVLSRSTAPTAVAVKLTTPRKIPTQTYRIRQESAQDILSATAIPTRRSKQRPSQRLPQGDHVADFSKFLLQDIQDSRDGSFVKKQSLPQLESLFGHIDDIVEGQVIIGNEGSDDNDTDLCARSISSESLASLPSFDDLSSSNMEIRSSCGRLTPRISHAEDCSANHPLADLDEAEFLSLSASDTNSTPSLTASSRNTSPPRTVKKDSTRSSFKSTLTSSLKALRSAARTTLLSTSGFGPHAGVSVANLSPNESLLAHNFFDIQPSLTDDRRPPPTMTRPSPELRRYLNPHMSSAPADSPTQLHFWQDERGIFDPKREERAAKEKIKQKSKRKKLPTPKSKVDLLPPVVQLATCLPPTIRTANASSPPIWLTADGEPINKNTSSPLLCDPDSPSLNGSGPVRGRDIRENRDFLRMFVGEMAMRRCGKLSDDLSTGRAKLWLPPLVGFQETAVPQEPRKTGAERWTSWSADE